MSNNDPRPTILLVDDEPINIHALGALLKNECRIRMANSGEKALSMLQSASLALPDLILLDIEMPGIDGYEVCRRIKEDPMTSGIAIIFVTARNSSADEEHGLNLGAVDYIVKPFNSAIVRARVHTHLNLKRKTDLLEQYALLDGLTGIPNRRRFDDLYNKEIWRCVRDGLPLSVIMMDIDHFKPFNDNYGHGAGDQCLQKVAKVLSADLLRPGDGIYRYGGEEFVALLPGTDCTGALEVAERLRAAVEALAISHEYSSAASVITLSLGTATLEPDQCSATDHQSVLDQADKALYTAKATGRNRCVQDPKNCFFPITQSNPAPR